MVVPLGIDLVPQSPIKPVPPPLAHGFPAQPALSSPQHQADFIFIGILHNWPRLLSNRRNPFEVFPCWPHRIVTENRNPFCMHESRLCNALFSGRSPPEVFR